MKKTELTYVTSLRLRLFLGLSTLVLFAITPISVFWDSYLYLGSADSLFTGSFSSNFHWVREPGYPLLIKLASYGIGIQGIIFVQFVMSWSSIVLFIGTLKSVFKVKEESKLLYLCSLTSLALSAGYASSILQQTSFVFAVAASMNILVINRDLKVKILLTAALALFSSSMSVILFAGVLSIYFFNSLMSCFINHDKRIRTFSLFLVLFVVGSLVTSSWYTYKSTQDKSERIYQDAWNFWEFNNTWEYQDSNVFKKYGYRLSEVPTVLFALNQFGPDTTYGENGLVSGESQIFTANIFKAQEYCGRLLPGPEEYIEISKLSVPLVCRNKVGVTLVSYIHIILSPLIPIIGLMAFLTIMYSPFVFGLKATSLIVLPIVSLSPYVVSSTGASRYGAPQLIFGPILIALCISALVRSGKLAKFSR